MHRLLEKQNALHTEASSLVQNVLLPILDQYGKVSVGGSYASKLLNYPDLDIGIITENASKELSAKLCSELIALQETSKCTFADRVTYPHTHPGKRPIGYWISPHITVGSNIWKVDIWLQTPEWHTGDTNRYEQELLRLDDEKRITILSLKEELIEKNLYGVGKEFVSVDVYEGVLRGDVHTIDELRVFTSSQNQ